MGTGAASLRFFISGLLAIRARKPTTPIAMKAMLNTSCKSRFLFLFISDNSPFTQVLFNHEEHEVHEGVIKPFV